MPQVFLDQMTNVQLDWAVAKALRHQITIGHNHTMTGPAIFDTDLLEMEVDSGAEYSPTNDDALAMNIIANERISVNWRAEHSGADWVATYPMEFGAGEMVAVSCGHTPAIAAMKCLVFEKIGDLVDIPEELMSPENEAANDLSM